MLFLLAAAGSFNWEKKGNGSKNQPLYASLDIDLKTVDNVLLFIN